MQNEQLGQNEQNTQTENHQIAQYNVYFILYYVLERFLMDCYKKKAFFPTEVLFVWFLPWIDFTQDDYNEMISFIEEELDYQYSMICIPKFFDLSLVSDYENSIQAAAEEYFDEFDMSERGIPCPRCCSGTLLENDGQPTFIHCTKCGMHIPCSLEIAQQQLYSVYQEHPCNLMLTCSFIPNDFCSS